MDIITICKKNSTTTKKSYPEESDPDTSEPVQPHLNKTLSLTTTIITNGSIKPCSGHHQPPPPQDHTVVVYSYKECLKNHAAKLGGLALDGCGEFLPSPNSTPLDPTSLTCAACGCHRNFHRRHPFSPTTTSSVHHLLPPLPLNWSSSPGSSSPNGSPNSSPISAVAPQNTGPYYEKASTLSSGMMRKRARTKFTEEQKAKMLAFAETLGWKMVGTRGSGSEHERMVSDFCFEVGVKRDVFKVWMHNNKHRREKLKGINLGSDQKYDDDANESNDNNGSKGSDFGNNN